MTPERFEILEHTADVGLRARGDDFADLLSNATEALASIIGVWRPGPGRPFELAVEADDAGALVVDWLSEVIYLHEVHDAAVACVEIVRADERRAEGSLHLVRLESAPAQGVQVKAVTYHQLKVEKSAQGWVAEVFVDI